MADDEQKRRGERRKGMMAFVAFLAGTLALLALVTWAIGWDRVLAARRNPETEDAYAWGTERPLQARVSGYVVDVPVVDDQDVAAGQVVARIEDDNYRADVDQAQAAVEAAEAQLAGLVRDREAAVAAVAQGRARARATGGEARFAAEEDRRQHVILGSELGLARAAEQARAEDRALHETVAAELAATSSAANQVEVLDARIHVQRAAIEAARARLELARIRLRYTVVRAPVAGRLGVRQVHKGDLLSPGRTVVDLTPLDDVWVEAFFRETQLAFVRPGQPVRVRFDAFGDVEIRGRVDGFGPLTLQQNGLVMPDNVTGNFTKVVQRVPVRIALDPHQPLAGRIHPGMSALVRVDVSGAAPVVTAR